MENLSDKVSSFLKGPSWHPGTSRLGDRNEIPQIPVREEYDPHLPLPIKIYSFCNIAIVMASWNVISNASQVRAKFLSLCRHELVEFWENYEFRACCESWKNCGLWEFEFFGR